MNKVVVITGGAQGLGAVIAKKMAQKNYDVVINYLKSEKEANLLKKELESTYNIKAMLIKADISNEEEIKKMVQEIKRAFSRIDCLVNNAAITIDNDYDDKTALEFETVLKTNLVGTFLTCKYIGNEMLNQQTGRIINISSTNGIDTNETYSMDYDASKSGIISLTHNFAKALAPFVLVNAIAPGWINTKPVLEMNPTYLEEERKKCLLERFANPEEIANVVSFLASDEASYINSSVIRIDGGLK